MARLLLSQLTCNRAEGERDLIELRVTTLSGASSTQRRELAQGETWRVGTTVDFEDEATIHLVHVGANHAIGRHEVSDAPTTAQDSPYCQFNWHGGYYTLTYRVAESGAAPEEAGEGLRRDGYCIAPYEDNRLRFRLPDVLVYYPMRNSPGKSDAGTFRNDSRALAADLRAWRDLWVECVPVDNGADNSASAHTMSSFVLADLEAREPSYTCLSRGDRLKSLMFSCHGFTTGIQLGFANRADQGGRGNPNRREQTERLLDLLASMATDDVRLVLYCCSTGSPERARQGNSSALAAHYGSRDVGGGWWRRIYETARDYDPPTWPEDAGSTVFGEGSFADYLRDGLHQRGRTRCEVYGHSDVAHAFRFPGVLRFSGGGSGAPEAGGQWVVDPGPQGGSPTIRAFQRALQSGSLRFRYPWMTAEEILAEIGTETSE